MAHQAQIRELKIELQPFKEELAKRNLDMLAKFATRRSSRVIKLRIISHRLSYKLETSLQPY
jgi:hypothetical protein